MLKFKVFDFTSDLLSQDGIVLNTSLRIEIKGL